MCYYTYYTFIFRLLTYLYSASWIQLYDNDVLAVVWANRYQNATLVSLCSFSREECVPVCRRFEYKTQFLKLICRTFSKSIRSTTFGCGPSRTMRKFGFTPLTRILFCCLIDAPTAMFTRRLRGLTSRFDIFIGSKNRVTTCRCLLFKNGLPF